MTDLLIRPEDSGEIPAVDLGPDTRNLAPYEMTGPALRLYATGEQPLYEPATIGLVDEPRPEPAAVLALLTPATGPTNPDRDVEPQPMPIPPQKSMSAVDAHAWELRWRSEAARGWWARLRYRGEHRAHRIGGAR